MKVSDPDGQVWRVSRRWVPWRRRMRDADPGFDIPSIDVGDDIVGLIVFGLLALLFIPILLLTVLVAFELALLLLLLPFAVLGRVLFGRRWHVEVRRGWTPWSEEVSGDWRTSALRIHQLADAVRRGEIPTRTLGDGRSG